MGLVVRLAPALEARGLTLEDVAKKSHLDLSTLEKIDHGRYKAYRLSTLETLCVAIGCKVDELFLDVS